MASQAPEVVPVWEHGSIDWIRFKTSILYESAFRPFLGQDLLVIDLVPLEKLQFLAVMNDIELLALAAQWEQRLKPRDFFWAVDLMSRGYRLEELGKMAEQVRTQELWGKIGIAQASLRGRYSQLIELGIGLCYPGHPAYPKAFMGLTDPPLALLVRGDMGVFHKQGLSVVGSRNPNELSLRWMEEQLGEFLAHTPCVVYSGGARGVDQMAHRLALRKGQSTVVYLPSGLDVMYPRELSEWQDEVLASGGAFVSEYWLDQPMRSYHFRQRNRMIAQSGEFLVVIEARLRSGTQMTANLAASQGREVGVVPSHPGLVGMRGGLKLIQDGATPLIDCQDLKSLWPSMSQMRFVGSNI